MENNCGIMGLREDEIELELGLSIGGSFGRAEKLKPIKRESKPDDTTSSTVADLGESVIFDDPVTKRKIQALRRQEAKKKREEKQQKRGFTTITSSKCHQNGEDDDVVEGRECKKNKVEEFSSGDVTLNLSAKMNNPSTYPVFPVRVSCPYPHLQFVPLTNGFSYHSVPCWGVGAGNEKGVVQPVAMNGGFQPGHVHDGNGYDSELNKKTGSNGSPMGSPPVVSDLQSSSNPGGHSSESVTNTSPTRLECPQLNCSVASNQKGLSEQSSTSPQMDSAQSIDKCCKEKTPSSNAAPECTPLSPKKAPPKPKSKPVPSNETKTTVPTKDTTMGKPPKPRTPPIHDNILSLRSMPCVSTTGPDGKTINGFLYRYTKSEVSIICVCHGSSFTPAEFVHHAGGTDVSHPLRHITVIPSVIQQM